MTTSARPWTKFGVDVSSRNVNFADGCRRLERVSHVAHLEPASRIAADRQLTAGLVFDESVLNKHRIRVVWLSPNDWTNAGGYRYGGVRFDLHWLDLIAGKKFFWVEDIAYSIPAARILITERDWSKQLEPYDPSLGDGPWWAASQTEHYWNGKVTLEIMYDGDIPTSQIRECRFVRHNPKKCSIDPYACPERDIEPALIGARFVSRIIARGLDCAALGLTEAGANGVVATTQLESAVSRLVARLKYLVMATGEVRSEDARAGAVARALMNAFSSGLDSEVAAIGALFADADHLARAVCDAAANAFGIMDRDTFYDSTL